jgi:hypothetical protein
LILAYVSVVLLNCCPVQRKPLSTSSQRQNHLFRKCFNWSSLVYVAQLFSSPTHATVPIQNDPETAIVPDVAAIAATEQENGTAEDEDNAMEEVGDDLLRKIYKKLPKYPCVIVYNFCSSPERKLRICELIPFGSGNNNQWGGGTGGDMDLLGFSGVLEDLPRLQAK